MITAIGQGLASNANARVMGASAETDSSFISLGASSVADSNGTGLLKQQTQEVTRVGFGQGTVSVPGALMRTITKNVQAARRLTTPRDVSAAKKTLGTDKQQSSATDKMFASSLTSTRSTGEVQMSLGSSKTSSSSTATGLMNRSEPMSYSASARQTADTSPSATLLNILV